MKTTAYTEHSEESLYFLPTMDPGPPPHPTGWDLKLEEEEGGRRYRYWLRNPATILQGAKRAEGAHIWADAGVAVEEWNGTKWEPMGFWGSVEEVRALRLEGDPWTDEVVALDFMRWAARHHYDTIMDMVGEWDELDRPGLGDPGQGEGGPDGA